MEIAIRHHRPVPVMIGTAFGGLWAAMGALALPRAWTPWAAGAAVTVALILLGRLWFSAAVESGGLFRRHAYWVAVVLEVAALVAAGHFLPRYGLQAYFVPAIGIIVGLHFIGLWKATGNTVFVWIAGAMCAVSAAAAALPDAPIGSLNARALFASYGNALVLWVAAARRT